MNTLETILERCAFQMTATGTGMAPLVLDGDVVLCSFEQPENGDLAVVSIDGGPAELWRLATLENGLFYVFRPGCAAVLFTAEEAAERLKFWGRVTGIVRPFGTKKEAAPDAPTSEAAEGGK